jgi:hypothetical protein
VKLALGALQPTVEHVDGILARVGEPHRAERILHDRAQQGNRGVALACGVQGADGLDQANDVERRSPADHGCPVHSVDLTPQVRSDQGIQAIDSRAGTSRCHAGHAAAGQRQPAPCLGRVGRPWARGDTVMYLAGHEVDPQGVDDPSAVCLEALPACLDTESHPPYGCTRATGMPALTPNVANYLKTDHRVGQAAREWPCSSDPYTPIGIPIAQLFRVPFGVPAEAGIAARQVPAGCGRFGSADALPDLLQRRACKSILDRRRRA